MSGAAYDACKDKINVKKMNGNPSKRRLGGQSVFHSSQTMMTTVMNTKNRAVPMNLAKPSANRPNVSGS